VIVGAALLKGFRLRRGGVPRGLAGPMAAGVAASFASTLASQKLISLVERDRALWPYAAYRLCLGAAVLLRLRAAPSSGRAVPAAPTTIPAGDGAAPDRVVESAP
jgi:undecaprenyl pyrophosphate phosphatase UppP